MQELFTIGHSTHEPTEFVRLLRLHGITAVGDVRSWASPKIMDTLELV